MDRKTIQFATAQIFLASLKGSKTLVIYDDPLSEIERLCEATKKVVEAYSSGIPEDLPVSIDMEVAQEIYLRCIKNDWIVRKDTKLSKEERAKIIKDLSLRYREEEKVRDYVMNELKDEPDDFLMELSQLSDGDLQTRLNEWTSYELEDLFDQVQATPAPKEPKKLPAVSSRASRSKKLSASSSKDKTTIHPLLHKFIEAYKEQENNNDSRTKYRNLTATRIEQAFDKVRRKPKEYHGSKFPPSLKYIRYIFMPWLIMTTNKGKVANPARETSIYKSFLEAYTSGKR